MSEEEIENLKKAIKIMQDTITRMAKEKIDVGTIYVSMALIMAKIEDMAKLSKKFRDETFKAAKKLAETLNEEVA
jgi:hypothetical protein